MFVIIGPTGDMLYYCNLFFQGTYPQTEEYYQVDLNLEGG